MASKPFALPPKQNDLDDTLIRSVFYLIFYIKETFFKVKIIFSQIDKICKLIAVFG